MNEQLPPLRRVNGFLRRVKRNLGEEPPSPIDISKRFPDAAIQVYPNKPYVYLVKDDRGDLLYVGRGKGFRAFDWKKRFPQFNDAIRYSVELFYFPTMDDAASAEVKAIRKLQPALNVQHNYRGESAD